MRPLSLTIEGFTCYKQRVALDLQPLDLFAICGPMGAGKTSLLDAMVFALYGKVPRLRRGYIDLISQGLSRMIVMFSFRLGSSVYRVTRRIPGKGRQAQAQLEALEDGVGTPLAEGMPAVTAKIEHLLGLPYEAFIQAVLLPQGEFAKFLRGEPSKRTELLRDILGHHIYDRMRDLADDRRRVLTVKLDTMRGLLEGEYADATPANLEARRQALTQAASELRVARRKAEAAGKTAVETRDRYGKCVELAGARTDLGALGRHEATIRTRRAQLDAAERASAVLPHLSRADEAHEALKERQRSVKALSADVTQAIRDRDAADTALAKATKDANTLDALKTRVSDLDRVKGLLDARRTKQKAVSSAAARLETIRTQLKTDRARASALDEQLSEFHNRVRITGQALKTLGYDSSADQVLEQAKSSAAALAERRETAAAAAVEAERAESERVRTVGAAEKAGAAAERAQQRYRDTQLALKEAASAVRAGRDEHAVAHLRKSLKVGGSCPVCTRPIATRLPPLAVPKLEALEEKHEALVVRLGDEEDKARQAANDAAGARASAREAAESARTAIAKAEKLSKRVADDEAALRRVVQELLRVTGREALESQVLKAATAMVALRRKHMRVQQTLEKAMRDYDMALTEHKGLRETIQRLIDQEASANDEVHGLTDELRDLEGNIRKVTAREDPEQERAELVQQIKELEERLHTAGREATRAATRFRSLEAQHLDAQSQLAAAKQHADALTQVALKAAKAAGIETLDAVRQAALSPVEISAIRDQVTAHEANRQRLQRRIAELEMHLEGVQVTEDDVRRATDAQTDAEQATETQAKVVGGLKEEIERLSTRIEKAEQLTCGVEGLKQSVDVYRRLAEDLKSGAGGFQSYMLEEAFTEIASGASERLMNLTNRYTLRYSGGGTIMVVDHDNAGQERTTDTLSGGETFLTSLALALELSDQVQRRHYGVSLDSLFIDEGFSTLDPVSLDSAAGAIESLRRDGRMVAIITHLPELADRLPARIDVEKHADGSTVHPRVG